MAEEIGDATWNAYIDKYNGNEPANAQKLLNYSKNNDGIATLGYGEATKVFNRNKGKGKIQLASSNETTSNATTHNKPNKVFKINKRPKDDASDDEKSPITDKKTKDQSQGKDKKITMTETKEESKNTDDIPTDMNELWKDIEYRMSRGDIEYIKKIFQLQRVSMTDVNKFEETLFLLACRKGQYEIASMCLLLGCDINKRSKTNRDGLVYSRIANSPHIEQLIQVRKIGNNEVGNKIAEISDQLSNQNGKINILIKSLQMTLKTDENINAFIDNLSQSIISAMNKRLAFSDDLLMLIWIYKVETLKINAYDTEIWKVIYSTATDIISKYPIDEIDFFWLNNYLLKSSIWYYKVNDSDMLFLELLNVVQTAADKQKQMFLIDPFTDLYENKRILWDRLMNFQLTQDPGKYELIQNKTIPRQDCIPFAQVSEYKREDLIKNITPSTTFSPLSYYAIEIYLPKLVLLGHILDDSFQESIRNIFDINIETGLNTALNLKYKRGPLKQLLRCKQKSQNDYSNEKFPQSCHVLDINRCSLIFNTVESLLDGLQIFCEKIKNNQSGSVAGIVRCKNGFNNDEYKFELSNVNYADIKLNVMIYTTNITPCAIIGECQFLLRDMMNFKNEAHRMYNIIRQEEFINDVNSILPLLSDKVKQLHTHSCIGNYKGISKIMIENELSFNELMKPNKKGKTVIYNACKNRKLRVLRFFYKLSKNNNEDIKDFLDKLFDDNNGTQQFCAVEMAIERGTYDLNKFLTTIDGLCDRIINDELRMHRVLSYLFRIDNWSIFLLWKKKLKINKDLLLKYMDFGLDLVMNGKPTFADKAAIVTLIGKNIFSMIAECQNETMAIRFAEFVMNECEYSKNMNEFMKEIFTDDIRNRNVIERCIQRDNSVLLKYLLNVNESVSDNYKKNKRLFHRLLARTLLSENQNIWKFLCKTFNITADTLKDHLELSKADNETEKQWTEKLTNLYKNTRTTQQYYGKNLFYYPYSIEKFELLREKLTNKELFEAIFEVKPGGELWGSAFEWGMFVNKTKLIGHILGIEFINNEMKSNKRILYRLLAKTLGIRTEEMFNTMLSSLNIKNKSFIEYAENLTQFKSKTSHQNTNLFHFICDWGNKPVRLKRFKFLFDILYNNNKQHCIGLLLKENNKKVTPVASFMQNNQTNIIEFILDNIETENNLLLIAHINDTYHSNQKKFSKFAKFCDTDETKEEKEEIKTDENDNTFNAKAFIDHKNGKNCCVCMSAPHGYCYNDDEKEIFLNRADLTKEEKNGVTVKTLADLYTMEMTYEISNHLKQLQNESNDNDFITAGYVCLKVGRTFIDGNRSVDKMAFCAKDDKAKSVYELYHKNVTEEINRMKTENEKKTQQPMLLLDIHGQGKKEFVDTVCIGTQNGRTTHGNENKNKILSSLLKYVIEDLEWAKVIGYENDEYKAYGGGFTVRNQSETNHIFGVQLEFGSNMRKDKYKRDAVAKAIAKGILELHKNGIYKT